MSDPVGYGGALLLAAATVPQAARLLRTRTARDFSWSFILLNFGGLVLLAARSGEIGEWAFFTVNVLGAAFWLLAFVVKCWPREGRAPCSRAFTATAARRALPSLRA